MTAKWLVCCVFGGLWFAVPAKAGPDSDALAQCLVASSTFEDRVGFVRWMFAAGSAHPAVQDIANASPEVLDQASKNMADMVIQLIAVRCRDESQKAVQSEGAIVFERAFETFGKVAATDLFSSPEVAKAMSGFEAYLDEDALGNLMEPAGTSPAAAPGRKLKKKKPASN